MRRSMYWIGFLLVFLLIGGLACSIGGEEEPTSTPIPPTATPVPPTATPEPPPPTEVPPVPTVEPEPVEPEPAEEVDTAAQPGDMVAVESPSGGVRLSHPEDWFFTDVGFLILLSSAADVDPFGETEELPDGVTMFIMPGPADDMETDEFSPDMLGEMAEEFGAGGDVELVGAPVQTTINGVPVQLIEFLAAEGSDTIHGQFALFNNGEQAAIVVAVGPADLWDEQASTVDAIIESIELFEGAGLDFDITPPAEGEWRGYLVYGDLVADEFAAGDSHLWTFDGTAGEYVTVILTPLGEGMDVALQLVDPDGTVRVDLDDAFAGEAEILLSFELPADGEYSVVVEEFFDVAGEYELELLGGDESTGAIVPPGMIEMYEIAIGEQVEATLGEAEEHAWIIVASGGEVVDITLTPGEEQDVTLVVVAPDGSRPVDDLDGGWSGEAETVTGLLLDMPGEYLVIVDEYWDVAGDYALAVDFGEEGSDLDQVEMGYIADDEVWQGTLEAGMYYVWLFEGVAGDVVSVSVTPLTDEADLQLALIDPDGEFLLDLDEAGWDEPEMIAEYELLATGTYRILVGEWLDAYAEYELSLTVD